MFLVDKLWENGTLSGILNLQGIKCNLLLLQLRMRLIHQYSSKQLVLSQVFRMNSLMGKVIYQSRLLVNNILQQHNIMVMIKEGRLHLKGMQDKLYLN